MNDSDGLKTDSSVQNEIFSLMMEDPFSFFMFQQITIGDQTSVSQLEDLLSYRADVKQKVRPLLIRMQALGMVHLDGDLVIVLKSNFQFKLDEKSKARLFPSLMDISIKRAVRTVDSGSQPPMIFVVSEDPTTAVQVCQAADNFRIAMREIGLQAQNRTAAGTRFVGLTNVFMAAGDYISDGREPALAEDWTPLDIQRRLRQIVEASHDLKPAISSLRVLQKALLNSMDPDLKYIFELAITRIEEISQQFLPSSKRTLGERPAEIISATDSILCERRSRWQNVVKLTVKLPFESKATVKLSDLDFHRMLSNLLENSYESFNPMRQDREISVEVEVGHECASVTVLDNGDGIPCKVLSEIREGKFQSTKCNGNAIGLRFVVSSLEALGGKLAIESEQGVGTKIRMVIPLLR